MTTETCNSAEQALTARLAEKIFSINVSHLAPLALSQAKMCLVDAIEVTLAGRTENAHEFFSVPPALQLPREDHWYSVPQFAPVRWRPRW